jgi:hypothetical protein
VRRTNVLSSHCLYFSEYRSGEKKGGWVVLPPVFYKYRSSISCPPESNGSNDVVGPSWGTSAEADPKDSDSMRYLRLSWNSVFAVDAGDRGRLGDLTSLCDNMSSTRSNLLSRTARRSQEELLLFLFVLWLDLPILKLPTMRNVSKSELSSVEDMQQKDNEEEDGASTRRGAEVVHLRKSLFFKGLLMITQRDATTSIHPDETLHNYIREVLQDQTIRLEYTPTEMMPADALTKSLPKGKHELCVSELGLISFHGIECQIEGQC